MSQLTFKHALGLASLAAVFGASPASAASYVFDLTADPATAVYSGDTFFLDIPYGGSEFEIAVGDDITVNLTLTSPLTTPTLQSFQDGVLFLDVLLNQGLGTPPGGLTVDTTTTLNDGTFAGETQFSGCVNCVFSAFGKSGADTPFTFSSLTATFDVLDLAATSDPVLGQGFRLSFGVFGSPPGGVPEPATWAMMLGGFGVAGGALRQRRAVRVAIA